MSAGAKAMCDRLVEAHMRDLASERPAAFAAYLDELEVTHADDPAMTAYLERSRLLLAGREATPC